MHTGETAVSGIGKIASTMCADVRGDETGFDERDENPDAAPAKQIAAVLHEAVEREDALGTVHVMIEGILAENCL